MERLRSVARACGMISKKISSRGNSRNIADIVDSMGNIRADSAKLIKQPFVIRPKGMGCTARLRKTRRAGARGFSVLTWPEAIRTMQFDACMEMCERYGLAEFIPDVTASMLNSDEKKALIGRLSSEIPTALVSICTRADVPALLALVSLGFVTQEILRKCDVCLASVCATGQTEQHSVILEEIFKLDPYQWVQACAHEHIASSCLKSQNQSCLQVVLRYCPYDLRDRHKTNMADTSKLIDDFGSSAFLADTIFRTHTILENSLRYKLTYNQFDENGHTPVHVACLTNNAAALAMLGEVPAVDGKTPMTSFLQDMFSIGCDHEDCFFRKGPLCTKKESLLPEHALEMAMSKYRIPEIVRTMCLLKGAKLSTDYLNVRHARVPKDTEDACASIEHCACPDGASNVWASSELYGGGEATGGGVAEEWFQRCCMLLQSEIFNDAGRLRPMKDGDKRFSRCIVAFANLMFLALVNRRNLRGREDVDVSVFCHFFCESDPVIENYVELFNDTNDTSCFYNAHPEDHASANTKPVKDRKRYVAKLRAGSKSQRVFNRALTRAWNHLINSKVSPRDIWTSRTFCDVIFAQSFNVEKLKEIVVYQGGSKNSEPVQVFWTVMHGFTARQQAQLYTWWTAEPSIGPQSLPQIQVRATDGACTCPSESCSNCGAYITTSTCASTLFIPTWTSKSNLGMIQERMLGAIKLGDFTLL
jgi:hypothetical protein